MGSKRSRDVAWGFFFYSSIEGKRVLHTEPTKERAGIIRSAEWYGTDRGPVFRITPPKPSAGKRGGRSNE